MKRMLMFAIVVCFASVGTAQAPPATWKPPSYATPVTDDQLQLRLQLAVLGKKLVEDAQDINGMARPFTGDSEVFHTLEDLSEQADKASFRETAVSDMLEMYSVISIPKDRMAAGKVLTEHIAKSKQALESAIKAVNLSLSTPWLPAGAAVTVTRLRDDIRSEIELFDNVKPR